MHTEMENQVLTRVLVVSDTHGDMLKQMPEELTDVLIHCGDLTEESKIDEFKKTIEYLCSFSAPLKIIIAGNHDFTLDTPAFERNIAGFQDPGDSALIRREFGEFGEARALFESKEAKSAGIVYLEEGSRCFQLANGASLKVYTSPYTPYDGRYISPDTSGGDGFGFRYEVKHGHEWQIAKDTDIVITHGPPRGLMDRAGQLRVGDEDLFAAIARTRPQLHCFGHVHQGWGAKTVTWREEVSNKPTHFADIDHDQSEVIETLSALEANRFDSPESAHTKASRLSKYAKQGYCSVRKPPDQGFQTLFVNAAIEGKDDDSQHLPWIVNLNLSRDGKT